MGNKPRKSLIERSYIETLPPELLSDILQYLPSHFVYRLYLCGSKQLQRLLTSERTVKSLIFDVPASSNPKWPILPSYFAHLKHYAFKVMNSSTEYSIRNMNIHVLPSSLVKLELKGQRIRSLFFELQSPRSEPQHPFMQQYRDLNAIFPLLEVLKLSTSGVIGPFFFSSLPHGLLVLVAYGWQIPVSHRILGILPPNLALLDLYQSHPELVSPESPEVADHLLIYRQNDTLEDVSFPNGLEKFICSLPWACGVVPFLPSSVTSVDMNEAPENPMSMYELGGSIPPNVTTFSIRGRLNPNSIKFLPKTLTHLGINGRCDIDWASTPFPLLTSLPNSASHQEWTLSMVQALPRSLTTWSAPHLHRWTTNEYEQVIDALPRSVRAMNISYWTLTANLISVLPPDLTELSYMGFEGNLEELSQLLPPSITKIKSSQMNLTSLGTSASGKWSCDAGAVKSEDTTNLRGLYPNLNPTFLTRFRLEKLFLFRAKGKFEIFSDLLKFAAPTLQLLYFDGSNWTVKQWASMLSPLHKASNCTWLHVKFDSVQVPAKDLVGILKSLPHSLTHLYIQGILVEYDAECFRCLPPHLTVLEIEGAQGDNLPVHDMRCLPKSLTHLKASCYNISMADFDFLPASVSTLQGSVGKYHPIEIREFS